ncbi:MAG: hypothetical protein QXL86_02345 [Candidatus Aenigmatarchaeota archaeon]
MRNFLELIKTKEDLIAFLVQNASIVCESGGRYYTRHIDTKNYKPTPTENFPFVSYSGSIEITNIIKILGIKNHHKEINAEVRNRLKRNK